MKTNLLKEVIVIKSKEVKIKGAIACDIRLRQCFVLA